MIAERLTLAPSAIDQVEAGTGTACRPARRGSPGGWWARGRRAWAPLLARRIIAGAVPGDQRQRIVDAPGIASARLGDLLHHPADLAAEVPSSRARSAWAMMPTTRSWPSTTGMRRTCWPVMTRSTVVEVVVHLHRGDVLGHHLADRGVGVHAAAEDAQGEVAVGDDPDELHRVRGSRPPAGCRSRCPASCRAASWALVRGDTRPGCRSSGHGRCSRTYRPPCRK